jgi:DNA-binding transcriptional LysR family regulator
LHTETRPTAWDDWLSLTGVTDIDPTTGQRYETFYFLLQAATLGLGVAIAPDVLVSDDLAAGRLVAPMGCVANGMSMFVLYPKSHAENTRLMAFRDWLIKAG